LEVFLHELTSRYHTNQVADFVKLIREFINCELQLYIGDTHLRSWAEEEARLRANEIAMQLRAPPWQLTIDELDWLCENAQEILKDLNELNGY
jgi:hypothetical protein